MISAATAATAVVLITLVQEYGLHYLFAATILMGVTQIVAGYPKLGREMRFVSRSVITGLVNAFAILILMAHLPERHPMDVWRSMLGKQPGYILTADSTRNRVCAAYIPLIPCVSEH